jgi:hypothetical protein
VFRRSGPPLLTIALVAACRPKPVARDAAPVDAAVVAAASDAGAPMAAVVDAALDAGPSERAIGPYEIAFDKTRTVYYVVSRSTKKPQRLLANLHGVCNPPGYACGYWVNAGANAGFLVCPAGNSTCGPKGPPTWTEPWTKIDEDLEHAIAAVEAQHPGEITREGSVLTAFSLGAYAAVQIARAHPGRWPYLVLTEADVTLEAKSLRASGVRAVALIAGEIGSQVAGQRRTAAALAKQGFPAKLWVMKGAGHHYSADIDDIMAEAVAWVLGEGDAGAP